MILRTKKIEIEEKKIIEVSGYYHEPCPGTRDTAPKSEVFEIERIRSQQMDWNGNLVFVDVLDLFEGMNYLSNGETFERIEGLVLEEF